MLSQRHVLTVLTYFICHRNRPTREETQTAPSKNTAGRGCPSGSQPCPCPLLFLPCRVFAITIGLDSAS